MEELPVSKGKLQWEVGMGDTLKNQQEFVIWIMGRKNMGSAEDGNFKDLNLGT